MTTYQDLIARKRVSFTPRGFRPQAMPSGMFPHQAATTAFLIEAGCGAAFLDTGLGKSYVALEWGRQVVEHTNRPVLMLAPLAVGPQHEREAAKFGVDARYIREPGEMGGGPRVWVTNYERLAKFDAAAFAGVILDESSILKSFTGSTTRALISAFAATPYRLACTATPAPNDHTELGTHAEFLGVMRRDEMLPRWFLYDSNDTGTWRVKRHGVKDFWRWVASWSRCIAKPSDLGFDDGGFALPPLNLEKHVVEADRSTDAGAEKDGQGKLFRLPDTSATSIHREKRLTIAPRAGIIAELVAREPAEPWVVWCDTDYEADALTDRIPDAIEVRGSMAPEVKEERLVAFSTGKVRVIVTKPSIAGFGLNWQHAARMAFVGLSFSYESFYQAIRRSWRFGQTRPVNVHVAMADTEKAIWDVVSRKAGDHDKMKAEMVAAMREAHRAAVRKETYQPRQEATLPAWMTAA